MTNTIRVRASLAVIQDNKIVLVPHYNSDVAPIVWYVPGGAIDFGESLRDAAVREFLEETGLHTRAEQILDVYESIRPEKPWHSVSITFLGHLLGGTLRAEQTHSARYGDKTPRWFSLEELRQVRGHPVSAIEAAFAARKG